MILHPGILALIVGAAIVLFMVAYGSLVAWRVLRRWDFSSSSEEQLILERKTFLVSSMVRYALGFEALSALLFVFTVDDIHQLFVGAMCATGTLNANPIGWTALFLKIGILLLAPVWIVLDTLDQRAGDYPLVRAKSRLLLVLTPVVGLDLYFLIRYFAGLQPEIITSCCGALFSESGSTVASEIAGIPAGLMMSVFYPTLAVFLVAIVACLMHGSGALRGFLSVLAAVLFFVSIASIIGFFSPYIYQMPTHHCPFDMFQGHYSFVAYPIYLGLFSAVFFAFLPGIFHRLKRVPSLEGLIRRGERKWLITSLIAVVVFAVVASWPVIFSGVRMSGF